MLRKGVHLTPIPIDEDLSSLSAILMNDDYYNYTLNHSAEQEGLQRANTESLICLKAKAFLDMRERKEKGEAIDDKHIRKHKADIFRLSVMLSGNNRFALPEGMQMDMQLFINSVKNELPDKAIFKEMGLSNTNPESVLAQLAENFNLSAK